MSRAEDISHIFDNLIDIIRDTQTETLDVDVKNILKTIILGIDIATARQFGVGDTKSVGNWIKITSGDYGVSSMLEATGNEVNSDVTIVTKALGKVFFGNGAGMLLVIEDDGTEFASRNYFKIRGGTYNGNPEIRSTRGALVGVLTTYPFQVVSDGNPIFEVKKSSGTSPRYFKVAVDDASVAISASTGNLGMVNPRMYGTIFENDFNAQNPASGSTIITSEGQAHLCILSGAVTRAAMTVVFPPNPINGQLFKLSSDCTISALTLQADKTIRGGPASMYADNPLQWKYLGSSFNVWIRI